MVLVRSADVSTTTLGASLLKSVQHSMPVHSNLFKQDPQQASLVSFFSSFHFFTFFKIIFSKKNSPRGEKVAQSVGGRGTGPRKHRLPIRQKKISSFTGMRRIMAR